MAETAPSKPWYREPWLWFVLTPLIVVVAVSSVTVTLAVLFADDTVIDNYYKEGRMINQSLEQDARAKLWGVSAELNFSAAKTQVTLTTSTPMPEALSLWLDHPFEADRDQYVVLESNTNGQYSATFTLPQGDWYLTLTPRETRGDRSAAPWRLRREIQSADGPGFSLLPQVQP